MKAGAEARPTRSKKMLKPIKEEIAATLQRILQQLFGLEDYAVPGAQYPEPSMGDLSFTLCFPLAKILKKSPKAIAEQIVGAFPATHFPEISLVEVGGNGYVNFRLNHTALARALLQNPVSPVIPRGEKAIVEHTSINPNKAAHVGHLRNACLGDALVRLLRFAGWTVDIQNYIDDTGVQLADAVVGYQRLGKTAGDLKAITGRPDYYFWDLYAETHQWIEQAKENKEPRDHVLRAMEEREEPIFSLSQSIANLMIHCHLQTMRRLGIEYRLLIRESDILGMKFWQRTFDLLKQKGAVTLVEEGKNKGCWVMKLEGSEGFEDYENADKVIVRSNGVVTYVGKDIAYQLWKFGLLDIDFKYCKFDTNTDGSPVWSTATTHGDPEAPRFGSAAIVYNVIDQRQSYLQKVVAEGVRALGYPQQAQNSIHFAYEMVALSPKTAKQLGFVLSQEDQERSFVEMSGRKGLGVKGDDLIERLEQVALERTREQYKELDETEQRSIAAAIAAGALRYFMIRYTRNTLITFDFDEALSPEGETGVYLQYSLVRAASILRKLQEAGLGLDTISREELLDLMSDLQAQTQEAADSWNILYAILKVPDIVEKALTTLEISFFAKHAYELAKAFNNYYHKYNMLHEPEERLRKLRIGILKMFLEGMQTCLDLLGIPLPARM
jgi:arginyl-tRNA synthetase